MRSFLITIAVAAILWLITLPSGASAQSDAEIALQQARTAFANEQFAEARDLLKTASQTDANNPDVFLLLGRSHYQLGEVDQALAAWRQTLRLAPAQAYAAKMVATLEGKILDVDARLKVIESLLDAQLGPLAQAEIQSLQREASSPTQHVQLLALEARALIDTGQAALAFQPLEELVVRDPQQAKIGRIRLLIGKAKLALDGESINEGLTILTALHADSADSAAGVSADLALISFRIDQGEDAIEELADWITANQGHVGIHAARRTMIRAVSVFLEVAKQQPLPANGRALSEADSTALTAAQHALEAVKQADESLELTRQLIAHIENRIGAGASYAAANEAFKKLLELQLPAPSSVALEAALKRSTHSAASEDLDIRIAAVVDGDAMPQTLVDWIKANVNHPRIAEARRKLVTAYLEQTRRQGTPDAASELSGSDTAAITVVASMLETRRSTAEKSKQIEELLEHWKQHYSARGAHAAAMAGQKAILALQDLPGQVRRRVLDDLADSQTAVAMSRLQGEVMSGKLSRGPLPEDLTALLKTLATINEQFPARPAWSKQASVGERIFELGRQIEWPAKVTALKATDAWALEFVLPLIVANHDAKTTDPAIGVVDSIVDCIAVRAPKSGLAGQTHQTLLDALSADHVLWQATAMRQLSLRVDLDEIVFHENAGAGRGDLNSALSDRHKSMLTLASKIVAHRPQSAGDVLAAMQPFLLLRTNAGYDSAVEEAYALLESTLPPQQLRSVRLAVAQSWVKQVISRHDRLLNNGFRPPQELDEQLRTALVRCYQLQSELEPTHQFVESVESLRTSVITHYRNLRYYDAAEAAIGVTAEKRIDWLDATAEFELANLRMSVALDKLADQTEQFEGRQNVALTPALKEAIAGFEKFVSNRPGDRLVAQAVARIMSVGQTFEQYEKYDVASEIYAGLETFALASEALQRRTPNTATVPERAAYAVARSMHVKATKTLAEAIDGQVDGADPPAELSAEFQAAVAAYKAIVRKYADGPLIGTAIGQMMEIALQHAKVGAWDVAESVYADLGQQQLPLRQPERLEFARALCEMGKAIPRHAQQVLAAITLWQRQTQTADPMDSQIAMDSGSADRMGGAMGGMTVEDESESMMIEMEMGAAVAGSVPPPALLDDLFGSAAPNPANRPNVDIRGDFGLETARAIRESELLAEVRRQQSELASQVAMMRDGEIQLIDRVRRPAEQVQLAAEQTDATVLSDAEIERRQTLLDVAYAKFQAIRKAHAETATARQAREQIMVIANHWRSIGQWQRSAALVKQFLADNPTDIHLPQLRHETANDYLAWAAGAVQPDTPKQELLDEVNARFQLAREELSGIIAAFPDQHDLKHDAQWAIATSHLSQARVVAGFNSTLARGQFVRAANELMSTADLYHDHPKINELPGMLWSIAEELTNRQFYDEAITVWNEMTLHYPGDPLAEQAALRIAEAYQTQLRLPLRAVESYLELNFARGGDDVALQTAIFQIASQLMSEKRWVESLHVLETFVDSFPTHASAGQALTMIGQVHQTNEVWEDAITAYRRVILEYDQGNWAQQSKWSIAQCTINLSRWEEAQGAYREYQTAYPEDAKVAEATARMEILKDLARFQKVVDEQGQRKAFDAQYQIAAIVRTKLANPVKAIIEFRKVAQRWPDSHLADDALFQVGMIYMELAQTENAREAFFATAQKYPTSPLADDALFQVAASFENEAESLAGVTRGQAIAIANEMAQRQAYAVSQGNRRVRREQSLDQIAQLKKAGKREELDKQTAFNAALNNQFDQANAAVVANWAAQQEEALTTAQLADRQDKINAALRKAVVNFRRAATVASADKADDALLRMAQIYDQRLKDSEAAMSTWLEIVKQYSGTTVAEDASWKIADYYEAHEKYADAIAAYNSFLRNYRRSPKASAAQAAIAENHEQLGNWVEAMDAYTNYINNYPDGAMASKAKEQIAWIKTYRL